MVKWKKIVAKEKIKCYNLGKKGAYMINLPTGCQLVDVNELKPFKKNPKNHNNRDIDLIVKSVERNGWGDPLLVCPETMEVLSGNGRLLAAKKLKMEQVPVVYAPEGLSEKQKADLVIASNKLVEVSDYNDNLQELMDMFELNPEDFGMKALEEELGNQEEVEPEIEFTEELREEHNYIILYFDNEVDWLTACEKFNIHNQHALDSRAGYTRSGVGRVVRGVDVLNKIGD